METVTNILAVPESIIIPRPEQIEVTVNYPSLEELKQYRDSWLMEAKDNGKLEDLQSLTKILCGGKESWVFYRHEWKRGNMTLAYSRRLYHKINVILGADENNVFGTGERVATVTGNRFVREDDFWIPGPWVGQIKHLMGKADQKTIDIMKENSNNEREALLKTLNLK